MPDPIYIAGPTASGKSAAALHLAEKIGGEIISVDSMQVYRGMDIGTAKTPIANRKRVPHHLIDILDPSESFDAAQFVGLARATEAEIQKRGHVPIYCGGTGLYFKALVAGLGRAPASDPELRKELEAMPLIELLKELQECDPILFAQIDQSNPRRVIRAIEAIRLSGKPYSALRSDWTRADQRGRWFGLERNRPELINRINQRVDFMFNRGIVDETRELLKKGLEQNRTAMQAIGYGQVIEHLRGVRALNETVELVKIKTRQYAKRQMTWFRSQLKLDWIEISGCSDAKAADVFGAHLKAVEG
jgi:tRNA dimethylallyltransferase